MVNKCNVSDKDHKSNLVHQISVVEITTDDFKLSNGVCYPIPNWCVNDDMIQNHILVTMQQNVPYKVNMRKQ